MEMTRILRKAFLAVSRGLLPYFLVSLGVGCVLSVAMITANWQSLGWGGALEMAVAMFWLSFVFNTLLMVPATLSWPILLRMRRSIFSGYWPVFSLATLLALNVVWILWNRLAMVHQWASVRPFITVAGFVQSLMLVVILVTMISVPFLRLQGRKWWAKVASVIAVLLVAVVLVWNGWEERRERRYPLERIGLAAGVDDSVDEVSEPLCATGKVILLGLDGLSWNVLVPLMEAEVIPTLSMIIQQGAYGYLDNGDDSLSPIVWTSIFTGRTSAHHGIDGYRKLNLPVSRRSALNLLLIRPTIDTFYGLSHLLKQLPSAGLWSFSHVSSNDRQAPAVWEIASLFGRTVVVVDPLVNLPVKKVNGAAIDFRRTVNPEIPTSYPAELRERWDVEPIPLTTGGTDASYDRLVDRVLPGVEITLELAEEYDPDLLIYYTSFPDTVSHMNWDFHSRGRVFIQDLPIRLADGEWEDLIRKSIGDRLFRAYVQTDVIVRRFVEAFPGATFVIVSDHGWTFSGYEHFGSPDGVFIISGPEVRAGQGLSEVSILDVAPTVLSAIRLPLSRELDGAPVDGVWLTEPTAAFVDRYAWSADGGTGKVELSEDELERLRELGYLE
jgi:hypothetical protein